MTPAAFLHRSLASAAAVFAIALASCGVQEKAAGDMSLGAGDDAKITVIEYASVTCGGCAAWQEQVWPEFKAKYVDTNKVRYVFREFPTPPVNVSTAGFLIARCAGSDKYFDVVHSIMESQKEWHAGTPPIQSLKRIAAAAGIDDKAFTACVTDPVAIKEMDLRIKAGKDAGVTGTPAFFVNNVAVSDNSWTGLSEAIEGQLAKN